MAKRVVVKIGSSIIAPFGKIDIKIITQLAKDISYLKSKGVNLALVSSGAVACGLGSLGFRRRMKDLNTLMAAASLGQVMLMDIYAGIFKKYKISCGQILLTWDDFDNRRRYLNARATINKLFSLGVIPIINENDAISTEEIKFGDNDHLSALVADLIGADTLIILSDVEGLSHNGKIIRVVDDINENILKMAKKENKEYTCGGMFTKIQSAKIAVSAGIRTVIALGKKKGVIRDIANGYNVGTEFVPTKVISRSRKRWIAFGKLVKGKLYIDKGAQEAIINQGKSLLFVGVKKVEGKFVKADAVDVLNEEGVVLGRGLVNYSSQELKTKNRHQLKEEVIHRDNFAKKEC